MARRVSENLSKPLATVFLKTKRAGLHSAVSRVRVAVSDIIDADPDGKERVGTCPGRGCRLARDRCQELVDLVDNRKHSWLIRRDKGRIDGRTAVRIVVGVQQGVVISGRKVADPVRAAGGTVPGEGGVADGVGRVGQRAADVEACLGVRVSAEIQEDTC